ncbi:MAG: cation efflux protein [uncultured bacterium]|nr:MAG: cation efflux protein [uncultured bacterium]
MKSCCDEKTAQSLAMTQAKTLKIVLLINALMFVVEIGFGLLSHSTALLADSLDMFGDAVVYGLSLYVLNRGLRWQAGTAILKGSIMALFSFGILIDAIHKFIVQTLPVPETMGIIGALALVANATCLFLLFRHRSDDINMRSTWICSRNDILSNLGVLLASVGVSLTQTNIPDVVIGGIISLIILGSSYGILKEAKAKFSTKQSC